MSRAQARTNRCKDDAGDDSLSRRVFARVTLAGVGMCYAAAIGYPVYRYLASPVEQAASAAAVTELLLADAVKLPTGAAMLFKFGPKPALLIHHADDTWTALDAVCTHLGCTVAYQPDKGRIHCACHGGVYDPKTGANVSGPPPKPLRPYRVDVSEKGVLVSRT
jgi:cytochrome b6-f complex iron-sulfur subunit